jgi:succinate dehydrogenase/fumarate reductase flavoprotein subunit
MIDLTLTNPVFETSDFDVIVVGGGGSGLATAVSAAEHGASVLLLEKQPDLGGATGIAVGSLTANRTSLQRQAGIQDSLEAHVEDAGKFAPAEIEARNNDAMRRFFLSHTAETYDWLTDLGLRFLGPNPEPPNRVERMHNVIPGAKIYIETLYARLLRLGGRVLTQAPVTDLIRENGRIQGVMARVDGQPAYFRANKGVVLAAGDYANAPDLIARFKGNQFQAIEGIFPHAGGDGHLLAERVGARLVNMDVTYGPELRFIAPKARPFQQLLPSRGPLAHLAGLLAPLVPEPIMNAMIRRLLVTWQHPENALFEDGAILINSRGERFCDERVWPDREIAIANQPGKICYILLDQRLAEKYSRWPHYISTAPRIAYAYAADYLKLRPDVAVSAPSLEKLAQRRDLPPERLVASLAAYKRQAQAIGQPALLKGPWLLLGPAKAYFTTTEGGVDINQQFQALDESGRPIPGLYAVGQNGLAGQIFWSHGLHICWAITSGRLAGKYLAGEERFVG